jgi:hypothetical protein
VENLTIKKTGTSPQIELNAQSNICSIVGESYSDHVYSFYEPVLEWLENYFASLESEAIFNIELSYFNSSSSKVLMDIFDMCEDAAQEGKNITVNWYYEKDNDALEEYGEEFAEDVEKLKFNIVAK